jgi:anaerobic selenocysteine-containing dehydrogenase
MNLAECDTARHDVEMSQVTYRTCPLCEAGCGLEIEHDDRRVIRIRGDREDVFSQGYLCPKGPALAHLHEDPDRLRRPLIRRGDEHVEVDWDEAFARVSELLTPVIEQHGRDSVAVYLGNPSAHSLSAMTFNRALLSAVGTRQRYSASTVDQMPKHVSCGLTFGSPAAIPVPDLDRTDHLVMFGANPVESNGSLCTAPDFPGRLRRIRERGGRVVVIDPRRTRSAELADEWVPIRPGTDAVLLAAMVSLVLGETIGSRVRTHDELCTGLDELWVGLQPFTPELAAEITGIPADDVVRLTREFVAAPTAVAYGRMGTTTAGFGGRGFGTLTSWLVDVLNTVTGNLDRPGGSLFPLPAAGGPTTRGEPGRGKGFRTGRAATRVSGLPEVMGEFPVAALTEEITAPGEGRVRALITVAGNPVISTPAGDDLAEALKDLECMISVDIYLNETTRHADVILPPPSPLERGHYDILLSQFAVRNVANYSPPVFARDHDHPDEWEILARLAGIASGDDDPDAVERIDDAAVASLVRSVLRDPASGLGDRSAEDVLEVVSTSGRRGPERLLDVMLRSGPYGDRFGAEPDGLSLDMLIDNPHGVDLGPLDTRLPGALRTPSGRIEIAPEPLIVDLGHLARLCGTFQPDGLVLVGRRDLRSNNSWMHNLDVLVRGRFRCDLVMHPDDAAQRGVSEGSHVDVIAGSKRLDGVPVRLSHDIARGVVSLPHGWGHDHAGTRMSVASTRPGVNSNLVADPRVLDPVSGTSVLNGIIVEVALSSSA